MNAWKYEIISRVEQDISFALPVTREISLSTLEIYFIFPHIYALFSIYLLFYLNTLQQFK